MPGLRNVRHEKFAHEVRRWKERGAGLPCRRCRMSRMVPIMALPEALAYSALHGMP